ncbi:MAG: hypothetical protein F9K49_02555 [Caedimonadaceae bacterium]|nr:MAG: hypothetical protein F9K49_02555 [Caedimonadaceae bacterium]
MKGKKTGGRKKGSPNKITQTTKQWVTSLIDKNRKQIEADLLAMKPAERVAAIEKLMAYVVPKASSNMNLSFDRLDETQLDEIVNELKNQLNE